jgi:DNA repair protein RAD16
VPSGWYLITSATAAQVRWRRIVLDEAHNIKDRQCSTAKAVFALASKYKWALSGTPLQNRVSESLIRSDLMWCICLYAYPWLQTTSISAQSPAASILNAVIISMSLSLFAGELYSLVRFLRIFPYAYYFCRKTGGCDCQSLDHKFKARRACHNCGYAS